jgi:saccharopine dehydrogenase (NAD+, L-lysine forming)
MGALSGKRILVAGGYGAVGRVLSAELVHRGAEVVIGGRNLQRAEALAREIGANSVPIDVQLPTTWPGSVKSVDLVVMCVDQASARLVEYLFGLGIDYADLTAGDALFRSIEALPRPASSAALLSVGLAPGLTNILAIAAAELLGQQPSRVDLGLLVGMADRHGEAGLDWIAGEIFDEKQSRDRWLTQFGRPWGRRIAHRVDFSDQHALMRHWPQTIVTTRLAFESRMATALLFHLADWFAGNRKVERLVRRAFTAVPVGTTSLVVTAEARGELRRAGLRFVGADECATTAHIAAIMLEAFYNFAPRTGVWHSHQVFDAQFILDAVAEAGIGRVELTA